MVLGNYPVFKNTPSYIGGYMRKALKIIIFSILTLIFASNIFPYATHSGDLSLDSLLNNIKDWIKQSKPEEINNDTYNIKTHPWLTLRAIQLFEQYYGITITTEAKQQIILGSVEEDYDLKDTSTIDEYSHMQPSETLSSLDWNDLRNIANVNRSENHFMNYDDDIDGLNHGTGVDTERNTSALRWAKDDPRNLTNFSRTVAEGDTEKGWRYIGHILHLLEDMSVPAHVRNDAHIFNKDNYEIYLKEKTPNEYFSLVGSINYPLKPISTEIDSFFKELGSYTRKNYFSDDTIFLNNYKGIALPVAEVFSEDNNYFYNSNNRRIAYKGWLFHLTKKDRQYAKIDREVTNDIFSDLGLKAVQYGAGLIKLFYDSVTETIDTTPPSLVSSDPPNGATNVPVTNRTLSWTFNEPMLTTHYSVETKGNPCQTESETLWQQYGAVWSWSSDYKTFSITPNFDLPSNCTFTWYLNKTDVTKYGGFQDLAGNPLPFDKYQGSFATEGGAIEPFILTATAVSSTQIDLSWTSFTGAVAYGIWRIESYIALFEAWPIYNTFYSNRYLYPNTEYCYQVHAYNAGGPTGVPGENVLAQSNVACATTLP